MKNIITNAILTIAAREGLTADDIKTEMTNALSFVYNDAEVMEPEEFIACVVEKLLK